MLEIDSVGLLDGVAEAMGKTFVTTELGGAGTTTPERLAIAKKGTHNLLVHAGILDAAPELSGERAEPQWLDMPDGDCFVFAQEGGLIEPCIGLGGRAEPGDVLAFIHPAGRTGARPVPYRAPREGIVMARHVPGLVKPGDCLAVLAIEI